MSAHLATIAPPVSSTRRPELAATGLSGRRVRQRSDFRSELRALLTRSTGRHRVTFIPVGNLTSQLD